jgi:excinuclease UvrABC nuclease subunit
LYLRGIAHVPNDSPDISEQQGTGVAGSPGVSPEMDWRDHFPQVYDVAAADWASPAGGSPEGTFLGVPAKWAVYVLADASDRPVQVLCVRNLRASLRRRLGGEGEEAGRSKRVDYREIVRRVYYRRVDSDFEADLVYLAAVRAAFPGRHTELIGFRRSWFVHVDPDAAFPRYTRTTDLSTAGGVLLGPVEDRQSAQRLIELVESAFDLCRYHAVLLEAPRGKACAYKEMGRCPAPCDGSIAMDQYRRMVEYSSRVLVDPGDTIRAHESRMRQAAAELRFEVAGRIKQYIEELNTFGKGAFRYVRPLAEFQFVVFQSCGDQGRPRGGDSAVKVFLVTPGEISEEVAIVAEEVEPGPLLRVLLERAEQRHRDTVDDAGAERIGLVTSHLFKGKQKSGVMVPLCRLDESSLQAAVREVRKQVRSSADDEPGESEADAEGIARETASPGRNSGGDDGASPAV